MLGIIGRKVKFEVEGGYPYEDVRYGHIISILFLKATGRLFLEVYGTCEGGSGFPDYYEYDCLVDPEECLLEFIS